LILPNSVQLNTVTPTIQSDQHLLIEDYELNVHKKGRIIFDPAFAL